MTKYIYFISSEIILLIKRLVVITIGAGVIWLIYQIIFPFFGNSLKLPLLLAIIATYLTTAYVVIPLAIRIMRVAYSDTTKIPAYSNSQDGFKVDPVNISVVGSKQDIINSFTASGWQPADPLSLKSAIKMGLAIIFHKPYQTAPFGNVFLFGRKPDLCFQIIVGGSPLKRHHVRFWECHTLKPKVLWQQWWWQHLHKDYLTEGQTLWIGTASYDTGISLKTKLGKLDHAVQPDRNIERDYVLRTLRQAKRIKSTKTVSAGHELSYKSILRKIITDNEIKVIEL